MPALRTSLPSFGDLGGQVRGLAGKLNRPVGGGARSAAPARVVTGLEIEPGQVIAAQVRLNGGVHVERAAGIPLAPDVVRDGEVADVEGLSAALKALFAEHKLDRQVRVGVANQRIMVRTIEFPPIADPRELEAAVRFKAQDEIPMPPETVVLDYQSLGVVDTMAGPRQRVVLVAARRDMVERLLAALTGAGLRPEGVDLSAFALIRALHRSGSDPDERVLYLHVGGLTNLVVGHGRTCVFTRVLGVGVEAMAAAVAERCVLPIEEARAQLFSVGLRAPASAAASAADGPLALVKPGEKALTDHAENPEDETLEDRAPSPESEADRDDAPPPASDTVVTVSASPPPAPAPPEDRVSQEQADRALTVRASVADSLRLIVAEVRNSLDYHLGADRGTKVSRVVLSGPAAGIPGVADALAEELRLPLSTGVVSVASSEATGGVPATRLTVAAGLAVQEVPA